MGRYKIEIKRSAEKEIASINRKDRLRIIERLQSLSDDPRPSGVKKLSGEGKYRIRQGNYRILYQIYDEVIIIVVVRVAHRREVYRER